MKTDHNVRRACWWVWFLLDFGTNKQIATAAKLRGRSWDDYGEGFALEDGREVRAESVPVSRLTNRDRKLSLTSSDTRSEETKSLKAMAIILSWPPLVKQEGPTCWAAAMDSWTSVTSSQKYFSSEELVELAKGHGAATSSGALNGESGLRWLMSQFVLSEEHGGQSDGILTPSAIEPKLRESHVVFIHKTVVADSFSHAWVIYGIDELAVYYMDPLLGRWEHGEWMHFTFEVQIALWRKQP